MESQRKEIEAEHKLQMKYEKTISNRVRSLRRIDCQYRLKKKRIGCQISYKEEEIKTLKELYEQQTKRSEKIKEEKEKKSKEKEEEDEKNNKKKESEATLASCNPAYSTRPPLKNDDSSLSPVAKKPRIESGKTPTVKDSKKIPKKKKNGSNNDNDSNDNKKQNNVHEKTFSSSVLSGNGAEAVSRTPKPLSSATSISTISKAGSSSTFTNGCGGGPSRYGGYNSANTKAQSKVVKMISTEEAIQLKDRQEKRRTQRRNKKIRTQEAKEELSSLKAKYLNQERELAEECRRKLHKEKRQQKLTDETRKEEQDKKQAGEKRRQQQGFTEVRPPINDDVKSNTNTKTTTAAKSAEVKIKEEPEDEEFEF